MKTALVAILIHHAMSSAGGQFVTKVDTTEACKQERTRIAEIKGTDGSYFTVGASLNVSGGRIFAFRGPTVLTTPLQEKVQLVSGFIVNQDRSIGTIAAVDSTYPIRVARTISDGHRGIVAISPAPIGQQGLTGHKTPSSLLLITLDSTGASTSRSIGGFSQRWLDEDVSNLARAKDAFLFGIGGFKTGRKGELFDVYRIQGDTIVRQSIDSLLAYAVQLVVNETELRIVWIGASALGVASGVLTRRFDLKSLKPLDRIQRIAGKLDGATLSELSVLEVNAHTVDVFWIQERNGVSELLTYRLSATPSIAKRLGAEVWKQPAIRPLVAEVPRAAGLLISDRLTGELAAVRSTQAGPSLTSLGRVSTQFDVNSGWRTSEGVSVLGGAQLSTFGSPRLYRYDWSLKCK
jgi:hypothetical protein